jgi:uroporphyrinogen-III decarboxylase
MPDIMTPRARWLAALDMQPVDRLPFWPKLSGSYPPAQPAPFSAMSLPALHTWIGSDEHEFVADSARPVRRVTAWTQAREGNLLRTVFTTPHGEATLVEVWDGASQSWHPIAHPIHDVASLRLMTAFYADESWEFAADAQAGAEARQREIGERAFVASGIGESPLMWFVEHLAGIETAHYLLADYPDEVEALFAALHASLLRRTEIDAAHGTADAFYFIENTSTTLISPDQYRRYCLPHLRAYTEALHAAGKRVILHMCGHLKRLLPDIATLPVAAYEAFTSPTLGNTTLLDGRTACPNVCLIGGTNATLWTRPADEIIAQVAHDLDVLPHHRGLVVTSAGVMPPLAAPETIKTVCDWVKAYPARM